MLFWGILFVQERFGKEGQPVECRAHLHSAVVSARVFLQWQRSTTASADLCQPTCEDPTPKCDKAPAEGCACNSRRPIWMAHHNACGTLAMCKGVKCNTISCHIDKKTGVTKISHSTRGDSNHQSYSCGVMSKDNECECICMEEKFKSKDEL